MKTPLVILGNWFLSTRLWRFMARQWLGHLTTRVWGYPKLDLGCYFKIKAVVLQAPENIWGFVGGDPQSLAWIVTNVITGAKFGHAGFVEVGEDGELYVSHMQGDGLHYDLLLNYLKKVDYFALLEVPLDPGNRDLVNSRKEKIKQAPKVKYDYRLQLSEDVSIWLDENDYRSIQEGDREFLLYCSEYPFVCCQGLVKDPKFKAKYAKGRLSFEPDDFYAGGIPRFEV